MQAYCMCMQACVFVQVYVYIIIYNYYIMSSAYLFEGGAFQLQCSTVSEHGPVQHCSGGRVHAVIVGFETILAGKSKSTSPGASQRPFLL